jgi:uncharacterized protein (TIGR03083 family)
VTNRWVPLVREERAALLGFLSGIEGDAWDRPTVCAGWTVREVLAHLVDLEVRVGRAYRGELPPLPLEEVQAENSRGVERWRVLPGEALRAAFWQHGVAAQRIVDALGDQEWRRPVRMGVASELRHVIRVHFHELAVHGHDMTSALGAPPVWGERVANLVELLATAGPWALLAGGAPLEGSLSVDVDGAGRWTLSATTEGWKIVPGADADATIATDAETFVLATTGRIATADALARSKVGGDESLAERILSAWRIV